MHSVFLQPSQTQQLPVPPRLGQKTLKLIEAKKKTGFTCALLLLDLSLIQAVNLSGCTFLKGTFSGLSFGPLYHEGAAELPPTRFPGTPQDSQEN